MSESQAFLQAATTILMLSLLLHSPWGMEKIGRRGLALMGVGVLVPLLDFGWFYVRTADRVEYLSQHHMFFGLFYGFSLLVSLAFLWAFVAGTASALRALIAMATGYLLHLLLALLTPVGIPLFEPFSSIRVGLPVFPGGHPLLASVLIGALLVLELVRRWRRTMFQFASGMVALYFLAGGIQFGMVRVQAKSLASVGEQIFVEPGNPWLTRWLLTVSDGVSFRVRRHGLDYEGFEAPEEISRWNDEAQMVRLLGDSTVRHFYYHVFRHPVVSMEISAGQLTLIMKEMVDQTRLRLGRTFFFEIDPEGQNQYYEVQRFE